MDDRYRYTLHRDVDQRGTGRIVFVMLNPSTATESVDDPTIRRCIGFAKREHCAALTVVNLFAWRATNPADLWAAEDAGEDIGGPDNDDAICSALAGFPLVVVAWGALHVRAVKTARIVDRMVRHTLRANGHPTAELFSLGPTTKLGWPRHPLYIPSTAQLRPWSWPWRLA